MGLTKFMTKHWIGSPGRIARRMAKGYREIKKHQPSWDEPRVLWVVMSCSAVQEVLHRLASDVIPKETSQSIQDSLADCCPDLFSVVLFAVVIEHQHLLNPNMPDDVINAVTSTIVETLDQTAPRWEAHEKHRYPDPALYKLMISECAAIIKRIDDFDPLSRSHHPFQGTEQAESAISLVIENAEQGDAEAQYILGAALSEGQGVTQDYAEAAKWWRRAAEQGDADAQLALATTYYQGQGVPQDYTQAAKWLRRAAEQGVASAQYNLGNMYDQGQGVPQDYAEAFKWFRRAAEQGHPTAQFNLFVMYGKGQGVSRDYVQAHMWLSLAAWRASGAEQKKYADLRNGFAATITPAQIAEAQRLARQWRPRPEGQQTGSK